MGNIKYPTEDGPAVTVPEQTLLAAQVMRTRVEVLAEILDTVWVVIVGAMCILAQVGFMMKETGSVKMRFNSVILLKTTLVVAISSLTFFVVGFGFSIKAQGGILGQDNFIGINFDYSDYTRFIYYLSLCVMMATIATCSIAERTNTDTYIFFSFVTSGFIFPIGLAWCWNDGWLQNLGFIDHSGASIVHIMGGVAGFIGTFLMGPRVGLFNTDEKTAFILNDKLLDKEDNDVIGCGRIDDDDSLDGDFGAYARVGGFNDISWQGLYDKETNSLHEDLSKAKSQQNSLTPGENSAATNPDKQADDRKSQFSRFNSLNNEDISIKNSNSLMQGLAVNSELGPRTSNTTQMAVVTTQGGLDTPEKFAAYKRYLQEHGFDTANETEQELKERFKDLTTRDPKLAEMIFSQGAVDTSLLTNLHDYTLNATLPQSQEIVDNSFNNGQMGGSANRSASLIYSKSTAHEVTPTRKTSLFRPLSNQKDSIDEAKEDEGPAVAKKRESNVSNKQKFRFTTEDSEKKKGSYSTDNKKSSSSSNDSSSKGEPDVPNLLRDKPNEFMRKLREVNQKSIERRRSQLEQLEQQVTALGHHTTGDQEKQEPAQLLEPDEYLQVNMEANSLEAPQLVTTPLAKTMPQMSQQTFGDLSIQQIRINKARNSLQSSQEVNQLDIASAIAGSTNQADKDQKLTQRSNSQQHKLKGKQERKQSSSGRNLEETGVDLRNLFNQRSPQQIKESEPSKRLDFTAFKRIHIRNRDVSSSRNDSGSSRSKAQTVSSLQSKNSKVSFASSRAGQKGRRIGSGNVCFFEKFQINQMTQKMRGTSIHNVNQREDVKDGTQQGIIKPEPQRHEKDLSQTTDRQALLRQRSENIVRFRRDFPQFKMLSSSQISLIFKMYKQNLNRTFFASNVSMLVAGTLVILITLLFMNAGASMQISTDDMRPNLIVMNTVISAATSGLLVTQVNQWSNMFGDEASIAERQTLYHFNVHSLCNAVLAGLVSVSASCNNIELWAACAIGAIGSVIYSQTKKLVSRFEIDDPLDVSEVHGFCGIWAVIAVGIFDKDQGFFYTGKADQLGIQSVGACCYMLWAGFLSFIFFFSLKKNGRLRVNSIYEVIGLDFMQHQSEGQVQMNLLQEEHRKDLIRQFIMNQMRNMQNQNYQNDS